MTGTPPQRRLNIKTEITATQNIKTQSSSNLNRRSFFAFAAGACSLLLINKTANAAPIALPERRLFINHPYAGESFNGAYFAEGRYIPDAMVRIKRILRDHNDNSFHQIDPALIELMARMRQTLGTREPLQIVSGYRSPHSNSAARVTDRRVAKNSFHMQGKAVDIRVQGFSLSKLRQAATTLRAGGVGTYPRRDFLHIDVGPVRRWG